ncbi:MULTISPECIES: deoxyribodipyrimidine photo-lyase [Halorussus]|uniref:deoxyribodipyrimidine photo-lyase n=1 Tax=Halorussus TaxID=1070314 RepID=UPI00209E96FF|nr:deoxyribodipyrimidine photo-lyase [Halorussus vallis]USZ75963.1 deoxyribodipyrimidine photo-lyase [Halorussus vallis]
MLDALESLRSDCCELGGDLLAACGNPREELSRIAEAFGANAVLLHRDYSGFAAEREAVGPDDRFDGGPPYRQNPPSLRERAYRGFDHWLNA